MGLFKYFPPARVDVLRKLTIRFTPILEFNDPFESMPDTALLSTPKFRSQMIEDILGRCLFQDAMDKATGKPGSPLTPEQMRRQIEATYDEQAPSYRRQMHPTYKKALANFRVLSFSRTKPDAPDALLLWGHYADSHKGFALEFDEQHEWVTKHDLNQEGRCDRGDVSYSVTRPPFQQGKRDRDYYLVKAKQWEYEGEHRLIRFAPSPELDTSFVDSLVKWPATLLRSVTLGLQTSAVTEQDIRAILSSSSHFSHVRLRRATLHMDEYRLEVCDA